MKHKLKHKLKYIELFENYTNDGVKIPYSRVDSKGKLNIKFPKSGKSINPKFNQLTTEVTGGIDIKYTALTQLTSFKSLQSVGYSLSISHNTVLQTVTGFESLQSVGRDLWIEGNTALQSVTGFESLQSIGWNLWIEGNPELTQVTGFESLQSVGWILSIRGNTVLQTVTGFESLQSVESSLSIRGNTVLQSVTGFNQLQSVGWNLLIDNNPNLVTLSIPSTLIKSVNYKKSYIDFENEHNFYSPEEFVNSDVVIQDCIEKFDPGVHSGVVVTQIIENVELWGNENTKERVYNHIAPYCSQEQLELLPDTYKHLYHSDFKNTGAKSVAKVATGVTYGLF